MTGNVTKRFGKRTYDLYARYPTAWQAKDGAKGARKKGFLRVRVHHNVTKSTRKMLNEWFVFVDVSSLKGSLMEPARKGWMHTGTPRKGERITGKERF